MISGYSGSYCFDNRNSTRSSLYLFLAVLFRRMGGFYYHW